MDFDQQVTRGLKIGGIIASVVFTIGYYWWFIPYFADIEPEPGFFWMLVGFGLIPGAILGLGKALWDSLKEAPKPVVKSESCAPAEPSASNALDLLVEDDQPRL